MKLQQIATGGEKSPHAESRGSEAQDRQVSPRARAAINRALRRGHEVTASIHATALGEFNTKASASTRLSRR
jgi:hypothetical protein